MPQLPIQANGDNYEPMELDMTEPDDRDELPVLEDANLDLETHISHYGGLSRIQRLEFIADHCRSLRVEALIQAINYIKDNTYNVKDYNRLFRKLQEAGYTEMPLDTEWVDTKTKQAGFRFDLIDTDLKGYRQSSMKENIRRCQDDLGEHYLDIGELELAFQAFSKSREYIVNTKNQINQCLNVIRVSVLLKRWSAVSNHVLRAESQPSSDHALNSSNASGLHCASGLVELNGRRYKRAAKHFLSANIDYFNKRVMAGRSDRGHHSNRRSAGPLPGQSDRPMVVNPSGGGPSGSRSSPPLFMNPVQMDQAGSSSVYWEILAPINVAVYGSLCALATFTRQELAQHLVNSVSFKQFAELDPQTREAVACFYESKYASCLSILQEIKNTLSLDLYLAPHVERLYRAIRNRALVQYFEPYSAASMHSMATAFNTTVGDLEREIITLIHDGHIKARIDSHNKILYAKNVDPRTLTFERAIKIGKLWQRQTKALISRTVILNAGLYVTNSVSIPDRTS